MRALDHRIGIQRGTALKQCQQAALGERSLRQRVDVARRTRRGQRVMREGLCRLRAHAPQPGGQGAHHHIAQWVLVVVGGKAQELDVTGAETPRLAQQAGDRFEARGRNIAMVGDFQNHAHCAALAEGHQHACADGAV